jgi:hypothetical protein
LLEKHGDGSNDNPLEHSLGLEKGSNGNKLEFEDVPCGLLAKMRESFGNAAFLEQGLSLNLKEFQLDKLMIDREVTKGCEVLPSFFLTVMVHQPTWGEGHPDHADDEDESWNELKADGYQPCCVGLRLECGAANVVGSIIDPETDHDAKRDGKLL